MRVALFVVSEDWYFWSHRRHHALLLKSLGFEVHVACRVSDYGPSIQRLGILVHDIPFDRRRNSLAQLVRESVNVRSLLLRIRPDLIHPVSMRIVLLVAASGVGLSTHNIGILGGLGSAYSRRGFGARGTRALIQFGLRFALLTQQMHVVVQNRDDLAEIRRYALRGNQVWLVAGSGVDEDSRPMDPVEPRGETRAPVVTYAGRMLRSKGVLDLISACNLLIESGYRFELWLLGDIDAGNSDSLAIDEIKVATQDKPFQWLGQQSDVMKYLLKSDIFVLPTRYREGIPKALLEAGLAHCALVATNTPGCRDIIRDHKHGILVEPGDVSSLAAAIGKLLNDPALARHLGDRAASIVRRDYSFKAIDKSWMGLYRELQVVQ